MLHPRFRSYSSLARRTSTAKVAVLCGAQHYLFKDRLDAYLLPKAVRSMIERAADVETIFEEKERAQVMLNSIGDAVLSTAVSGRITYRMIRSTYALEIHN